MIVISSGINLQNTVGILVMSKASQPLPQYTPPTPSIFHETDLKPDPGSPRSSYYQSRPFSTAFFFKVVSQEN